MSLSLEKLLDATGRRILRALQENARASFSEIGRAVGLSTPAVAERVHRMEEVGLITGYRAEIDAQKLGLSLTAFIRLRSSPDKYPRILALVDGMPEVLECYHVTGDESFVLKVIAATPAHLGALIDRFSPYGHTATSIVLSTPLKARAVDCAAPDGGERPAMKSPG